MIRSLSSVLREYDGHDPKLAIGPTEIQTENSQVIHSRIRRWGWSELLKLRDVLDEAISTMDEQAAKGKSAA